jgi:hypothetical protein
VLGAVPPERITELFLASDVFVLASRFEGYDTAALAQALRRLIGDPAERRRLATNARAAAARLPTWQDSARLFVGAVETVR